jgi:hypothetical protein
MFCPGCGNAQVNDAVRFCVKCGLGLEGVKQITAGNAIGVSPKRGLSRRAKGILQGVAIVPAGLGLWLLFDIFYEAMLGAGIIGGLYAMVTLIVLTAVARVVYALMFEGTEPTSEAAPFPSERVKELLNPDRSELPAANETDVYGVEVLPPAGEVAAPHSVTEHTTTKLDRNS